MILFILSGCLMQGLVGDSDHPFAEPEDPPTISIDSAQAEDGSEPIMDSFEAESLDIETDTDSNTPSQQSSLSVEADLNAIFVEHQNVDLHCSPELFDNEVRVEDSSIFVEYMLGNEPRSCRYNLRYTLNLSLEPGTYALKADGDAIEFQVE